MADHLARNHKRGRDRIAELETARNWNSTFPVGTEVVNRDTGEVHVTESPAARDQFWEAAVFVSGVDEPVPLRLLEVPGFEVSLERFKSAQPRPRS